MLSIGSLRLGANRGRRTKMTNHPNRSKLPNMKRWSDEKLRKELAFSGPADDGSEACGRWNEALQTEAARREWPGFAPLEA